MPTHVREARSPGVVAARLLCAAVAFVVLGNLAILAASWVAGATTDTPPVASVSGVDNLQAVDENLWRGGAPTAEGYRGLAAEGVRTVVDLRAEEGVEADGLQVENVGMNYLHLPIRDGQLPKAEQVAEFLRTVQDAPGPVFVHCGAGVGRTGAMAGAYLVAKGESSGMAALRQNLAVGPPSLEQIAFVRGMHGDETERPGAMLTAVSRVLDFPRRAWHMLGA